MNRMTRGVVLVAIGAVIGALVLASTVDESGPSSSQATTTEATTTTATNGNGPATTNGAQDTSQTTSSTPSIPVTDPPVLDPAVVRVQVFNATGVSGAATRITNDLTREGYLSLPAGNAPEAYQDRSQSYVYYTQGYLGNARAITIELELSQSSLRPIPPDFVIQTASADIAVVIGNDSLSTRGQ